MLPDFQDFMMTFVDNAQRFAEMMCEARERRLAREACAKPPAEAARETPPPRDPEPPVTSTPRPASAPPPGEPIPTAFIRIDGRMIPIFDSPPTMEEPPVAPPSPTRPPRSGPSAKLDAMLADLNAERELLRAAVQEAQRSAAAASANVSRYGPDLHLPPPSPPPRSCMHLGSRPETTPTSPPTAPPPPVSDPPSAQLELPFNRASGSAQTELHALLDEERRARMALDVKLTRALTALAEQEEQHTRGLASLTEAVAAQARTLDAFMAHNASLTDKLASSIAALTHVLTQAAPSVSKPSAEAVIAVKLVEMQESVHETEIRLLESQREILTLLRQARSDSAVTPSPEGSPLPVHHDPMTRPRIVPIISDAPSIATATTNPRDNSLSGNLSLRDPDASPISLLG